MALFHEGMLVHHRETHVDGRRMFVFVLHFRLCQRRTAIGTPMYRFRAFAKMAVGGDFSQCADDVGFKGKVHGQVRIVPIAQYAQADEFFSLDVDLFFGVSAAFLAKLGGRYFHTSFADRLFHHQFDRQSVAIPTRHVGRIETAQSFGFDDNVLQHLIYRMADVDRAIGVRRAVMQNELRPTGADLANFLIQLIVVPFFQHLRFALRQIGFHRKLGLGEVQGLFVIHGHDVVCVAFQRLGCGLKPLKITVAPISRMNLMMYLNARF